MLNSFATIPTSLTGRGRHLAHPDDVVRDATLSLDEKRAILASWASDAHAVADAPTLRQLDSGAIVDLDVILHALQALDGELDAGRAGPARPAADLRWWRGAGRHEAILTRWRRRSNVARRRDDDDDPPPCPASNALPLPPSFVPAFGRLVA